VHYYKFNIADWHLATSHLSLEEEAIYFKLINFYYDSESPIPLETQTVIRRLRLGSHSDKVGLILEEFFEKRDDGWHHLRCDDELQKYKNKAENNKKIGKLGGRPKKINNLEDNPTETQTVLIGNPKITLTTNHKPITNKEEEYPSSFIKFWNEYPRKVGKSEAYKAWKKAKPDTGLLALMLQALETQKTTEQWKEGIIPNPSTWLNQKRWEDEVAKPAQVGNRFAGTYK